MKRSLFLITFTLVLLMPSLAGCANGGAKLHTRPEDAGSSPRDAAPEMAAPDGVPMDAAARVPPQDAAAPMPDAFSLPDAGSGEHRLMIALNAATRAQCPAGWRIRLWLTNPPVESTRGLDLELHIPDLAYFGPWSSLTLWCDERMPQWFDWDAANRTAQGTGVFSELSLDGVDLRTSTMLCQDPLAPGEGDRPILMWDGSRRGSCPP
jgi:hypothetical protein